MSPWLHSYFFKNINPVMNVTLPNPVTSSYGTSIDQSREK